MSASVLVVWLDALEPTLAEELMASGEMPNLAAARRRGSYGRLKAPEYSLPECSYSLVLTGQPNNRTGAWLVGRFDPQRYRMTADGLLDRAGVPVFLPRERDCRIGMFDVPQLPLQPGLHGVQLTSWGAHSPGVPAGSVPPEAFAELSGRHGSHPAGPGNDYACLDDAAAMQDLYARMLRGLELRAGPTCELLRREPWDLFFTTIGETHSGGHQFWPLPACTQALAGVGGAEAVRKLYRVTDRVLGRVIEAAGPEARCLAFSPQGMQENHADLGSMVFLSEYLFRWSFPGMVGLDFEGPGALPSPESQAGIHNWVMELWHRRHRSSRQVEALSGRLSTAWLLRLCRWLRQSPPLAHPSTRSFWGWQPTTWYEPYWPFMKAFALVSNSDGFIRLNLQGRESNGRIAPRDVERTCAEITEWLHELRDPRSGNKLVERVIDVSATPEASEGLRHGADLIVKWSAALGNESDSPRFGRLGPVPYHRTGAHSTDGLLCAWGPGLAEGQTLPTGSLLDVAPTILSLLGRPGPAGLPGRSLLSTLHSCQAV